MFIIVSELVDGTRGDIVVRVGFVGHGRSFGAQLHHLKLLFVTAALALGRVEIL